MLPSIIIPEPRGVKPDEQACKEFLQRWGETKQVNTAPARSVAFRHDPLWRDHPLSIQGIRERRNLIGRVGPTLTALAIVGFSVGLSAGWWVYWR